MGSSTIKISCRIVDSSIRPGCRVVIYAFPALYIFVPRKRDWRALEGRYEMESNYTCCTKRHHDIILDSKRLSDESAGIEDENRQLDQSSSYGVDDFLNINCTY
jgi:hypothetical protein